MFNEKLTQEQIGNIKLGQKCTGNKVHTNPKFTSLAEKFVQRWQRWIIFF